MNYKEYEQIIISLIDEKNDLLDGFHKAKTNKERLEYEMALFDLEEELIHIQNISPAGDWQDVNE